MNMSQDRRDLLLQSIANALQRQDNRIRSLVSQLQDVIDGHAVIINMVSQLVREYTQMRQELDKLRKESEKKEKKKK